MSKRKRGWDGDPLVPISGERLRAAIMDSGLSVASVARRHGMPQPTLHTIVSGKTKKCRARRRSALARQFGIQEGWLAGERGSGPFYDRQLDLAEQQGAIVAPEERRAELPPLAELKAARLIENCLRKWEDDFRDGLAPPPDPRSLLGKIFNSHSGNGRFVWIGSYLEHFLPHPYFLRLPLYGVPESLTPADAPLVKWYMGRDLDFTLAWIATLDRLLAPWLEGKRPLDYETCYALLQTAYDARSTLFRRAKYGGALGVVSSLPPKARKHDPDGRRRAGKRHGPQNKPH